jgi:HPt (histidine-containing phosphotransfer) domain-containing protein
MQRCNDALLSLTGYLARAGASEKLLRRVFRVFLSNLPMRTRIQTSIASQDPAAIQHAAHMLKGSASLIGAGAVTEAARDVEMMAKSGKMDGLEPALETLDHELKRLPRQSPSFTALPKGSSQPVAIYHFGTHAGGSHPTYRQYRIASNPSAK